jgi:hypothetical protein
MFVISTGLANIAESEIAVRSIWPPPSPCDPSILTGSTQQWRRFLYFS